MGREGSTLRALAGLLTPGGVIVAAAWALQHEPVVREAAAPYVAYFAFGALLTAILLCWYHDQSRLLSIAIAIGLTLTALTRWPDGTSDARQIAVLVLPLIFVLATALPENGVITLSGLTKVASVAVPAVLLFGMRDGTYHYDAVVRLQQSGVLRSPAAAAASFAAAAAVLLGTALRRRSKAEQGLFWALVASFLAVRGSSYPDAVFTYSGAAGLVLVLTALEHGYDIAYRDELTGLLGRRAFNTMMGQLGRTYAIAMCDVDRFKSFNDTYGHDAGDQVLRMVAARLSQVAGGGRVFRYGGEEFLVIFPGRSAREAAPFVEAVRKAVADARFVLRGPDRPSRPFFLRRSANPSRPSRPSVGITISIGLAERTRRHSTPELVLDAADAALYRAKEAGRNCVRIADYATAADHRAHQSVV